MVQFYTYKPQHYEDLVDCIWIARIADEDVDVIVPPCPYINFVFPITTSYWLDGKCKRTPQVEGLHIYSKQIRYQHNSIVAGVRFYPHGLYPFLQMNGSALINNSREIQVNELTNIEQVDTHDEKELVDFLNLFLIKLYNSTAYDKVIPIGKYYRYLKSESESISIYEFCKRNKTNYSSFNRHFKTITGLSPKRFNRLLKFRKSLCDIIDTGQSLTDIGINSGYYDQAHFIKEFKLFVKTTPSGYQSNIRSEEKDILTNYNFRIF